MEIAMLALRSFKLSLRNEEEDIFQHQGFLTFFVLKLT